MPDKGWDCSYLQNPDIGIGTRSNLRSFRHNGFQTEALTTITSLCESGALEETIMAIAGYVSLTMLSHYAHIRTDAKRKAVEAICRRPVEMPAAKKAAS